jgi:ribulose-phosphate 3-epimerase
MRHLIAPSVLSADFGHLSTEIEMLNRSQADWIHVDVMDGVFVPNISFGFPIIKYLKSVAKKPLDVHLMIVKPERYFREFKESGADLLTIQYEASIHLNRSIHAIRELGMKPGVAINPHTNILLLEDIITDVHHVLVMSVNPGFGGQKFIEHSLTKISQLKELILDSSSQALIEVDGGITLENAPQLLSAGADILVAGHTIFSQPDPAAIIRQLKELKIDRS